MLNVLRVKSFCKKYKEVCSELKIRFCWAKSWSVKEALPVLFIRSAVNTERSEKESKASTDKLGKRKAL